MYNRFDSNGIPDVIYKKSSLPRKREENHLMKTRKRLIKHRTERGKEIKSDILTLEVYLLTIKYIVPSFKIAKKKLPHIF